MAKVANSIMSLGQQSERVNLQCLEEKGEEVCMVDETIEL